MQRIVSLFGGDERIWTSAALTNPNSLANCPLQPLGYTYIYIRKLAITNFQYFGGEGGIRTHGRLQTYANFQDWCHKPTRPPLHDLYITILNYLLSRYILIFNQKNFHFKESSLLFIKNHYLVTKKLLFNGS